MQLQPLATDADPLTTVTGWVLNTDGSPAAGAQVVVDLGYLQQVTLAGSDGSFTFGNVPTLQGSLAVAASLRQSCAVYNTGRPRQIDPLPGDTTDAGTLVLAPDRGPIQEQ